MPLLHLVPRRNIYRAEAVHRESEARMAIEQANVEATRIELLKRKSRPSATAVMPKQRPLTNYNDSGETPPVDTALQGLYKKFPGLKRDLIKSIHQSKFIPRMLFKLRYAQGVNADRRTQLEVLIQDGKIEVASKDYLKDYGRTPTIWTEGPAHWLESVHVGYNRAGENLRLANCSTPSGPSIPQRTCRRWALLRPTLDRQYVDRFCPNQSLADSITTTPRRYPTEPNDPSVICRKWNTPESCHWAGATRKTPSGPA
jgi:hypothetical protein